MSIGASDYNVLSYLLKSNTMSFEQAIEWSYAQYSDKGVDPFIEKISLAADVAEIHQLIENTYQVYGEPSEDFMAGEVAQQHANKNLPLHDAIVRMLYDLELPLTEKERQELYLAD